MVDFQRIYLLPEVLPEEISLVSTEYIQPPVLPPAPPGHKSKRWPNGVTRRALPGPHDRTPATMRLVEKLGDLSAEAQGLKRAVTTPHRLSMSGDHMYILREPYEKAQRPELVKAIGFIRVGQKSLYLADITHGHGLQRHSLLCVLDFFVHPAYQRQGHGKRLYEHALMAEKCTPAELGLDRPSPKFLAFMAKYYGLNKPVFQANRYVVYSPFFATSRADKAPTPYWKQGELWVTATERKKPADSPESGKLDRNSGTLSPRIAVRSTNASGGGAAHSDTSQCTGGAPSRGTAVAPSALPSSRKNSSSSDRGSQLVPTRSSLGLGQSKRNGDTRLAGNNAVNLVTEPRDRLVCNPQADGSEAEEASHTACNHVTDVTKPGGHSEQFANAAKNYLGPLRAVCPPAETGILGATAKVTNCTSLPANGVPLPASHHQGDLLPLQHRNGQRSPHVFVNTRTRGRNHRRCEPVTTMPDEPSTALNTYAPRSNRSEAGLSAHLTRSHQRRNPWSYEPGESAIAALCNGKMSNKRGPRR